MDFSPQIYSNSGLNPIIMQSSNYFWTAEAKAALVIAFLASDEDIEYFAKKYELPESQIRDWINQFLEAGKKGFNP